MNRPRWLAAALAAVAACGVDPTVKGTPVPVPNPELTWSVSAKSDWTYVIDLWLHDDALVVATEVNVVAYDRASGRPKWTVVPPEDAPGNGRPLFCGASPSVGGNRVALAYGRERQGRIADCTNVAALDLGTGKLVWHTKIASPDEGINGAPRGALLEILGDTLIVGWDAYVITHRMLDGTQVSKVGLIHDSSRPNCEVHDLVAAKDIAYLTARCLGPFVPDQSVAIVGKSGKLKTVKDFTRANAGMTIQTGHLVSTSPTVLLSRDKDNGSVQGAYLTLDPALAISTTIPIRNDLSMEDFGTGVQVTTHPYYRTLVAGQTLVTVSNVYLKKTNTMSAWDLTTGQRRWETSIPNARILTPVAVDGSSIIAATDTPATIRIDIADGSVQSTKDHPGKGVGGTLHSYRFVWADERMYAVRSRNVPVSPSLLALG